MLSLDTWNQIVHIYVVEFHVDQFKMTWIQKWNTLELDDIYKKKLDFIWKKKLNPVISWHFVDFSSTTEYIYRYIVSYRTIYAYRFTSAHHSLIVFIIVSKLTFLFTKQFVDILFIIIIIWMVNVHFCCEWHLCRRIRAIPLNVWQTNKLIESTSQESNILCHWRSRSIEINHQRLRVTGANSMESILGYWPRSQPDRKTKKTKKIDAKLCWLNYDQILAVIYAHLCHSRFEIRWDVSSHQTMNRKTKNSIRFSNNAVCGGSESEHIAYE